MDASKLERCLKIPQVAGVVFDYTYPNDLRLKDMDPDKARQVFQTSINKSPDYRLTVASAFLAANPDYEVPPDLLRPENRQGHEIHGQKNAHAAEHGALTGLSGLVYRLTGYRRR